ncbi:hypothetical protein BGZ49_002844 [Haplosporangium sp. Z 27]|nr:hypothetical protein BGZ49_002844 [Haplosporangium sp. Z 27]
MDPLQGGHPKICKALRKLATWNSDRHTKSIIKLLLQVLMNHWRERQGIPTLYQSHKLSLELQKSSETQGDIQESDLTKDLESKLSIQEDQESSSMLSTREKDKDNLQAKGLQKTIESESSETKSDKDIENERENRIQEPVENDFYDFLRLQSHFEDWDEEDNKDWNKQSNTVLSLLEMAGLTEMVTERDGPLKTITSTDVKKLISALESNAFGMFDRTKNKPVCFGRAIYPIASFFNHSCECNSTAVQADGSMQEVTKDDILGYLNAEEEANILEKNIESSKQSISPSTPTVSSLSEQTEDTGDDSKVLHVEPSVDDNSSDAEPEPVAVVVDPYDSRVGQFRMMTFYSIEDITNGNKIEEFDTLCVKT